MNIEELVPYRTLLENLSDGVYFTDRDRQILFWNRGAELISGYPAAEVVGKHCCDNLLVHVDVQGHSLCTTDLCPIVRTIRSGEPCSTEAFLRHKQGHRLPVLIRTMPIRGPDGDVVGAVEIFTANSTGLAMKRTLQELQSLALVDPLTGLFNRRRMEAALQNRLEEHRRYGSGLGVTMLDIDGFKSVNDTYGHETGDEALRVVARNLINSSRAFDTPGRWGGEEFLILSERVDLPSLQTIAERYRFLIEHSHIHAPNESFGITVSLGATLALPDDTADSVVARADRLMYKSKRNGKNRATIA